MQYQVHLYDLPDDFNPGNSLAIDTEAMGLKFTRDRLCLVQLSTGSGMCHLVHFPKPIFDRSPHLVRILNDERIEKIFHYGRFDIALLTYSLQVQIHNVFCTKIASRLTRTYSDKHGLKDLCKELLGVEISKEEQSSDWGASTLTDKQCQYAMRDVLYLHQLKEKLDLLLERENRTALAQACFQFLPYRCEMDLLVDDSFDIFSYNTKP